MPHGMVCGLQRWYDDKIENQLCQKATSLPNCSDGWASKEDTERTESRTLGNSSLNIRSSLGLR